MKKFAIGLLALMFVLASSAFATIRYVSTTGAGTYTTIDAAWAAATTGDTILVGPGTYNLAADLNRTNTRGVFIGAGWDQTIVNHGTSTWYFNGAGSTRSSVEGFRLNGGTNNMIFGSNNPDSTTFRRCYVNNPTTGNWTFLWGNGQTGRGLTLEDCIIQQSTTGAGLAAVRITDGNYPTTIRNCVFINQGGGTNGRAIAGGSASGTVEVYNSVFLNFTIPFSLSTAGGPLIAINNIFHDFLASPSFGSYNAVSVWDYNAATTLTPPGTNALLLAGDPFVAYDEALNYQHGVSDLHLDPTNGAACINSGHPSLLDFTDGTQSDRGVYGGPKPLVDNGVPNYPWAVNILLNPNLVGVGTPVNATALGRVGPQY